MCCKKSTSPTKSLFLWKLGADLNGRQGRSGKLTSYVASMLRGAAVAQLQALKLLGKIRNMRDIETAVLTGPKVSFLF
jgi:hypothetical protein